MENIENDIDIYYQINSYDEVEKDKVDNIKNSQYFLIELKNINRNKLSFEFLEQILVNDGVDLSQIKEFKYIAKEEKRNNKIHILLKSLSDTIISELQYLNQIYLHLIVEEETETPDGDVVDEEMEEFNIKIENCDKKINEISMEIEKEKRYNEKVLSENLYNNSGRIIFTKQKNDEFKYNKTIIGKPSSSSIINLNEDDFFDKDNNSIIINNNDLIYNKNLSSNTFIENKMNSEYRVKLCYLYSNPLIYKDNKNIYKSNDCFNEIVSIYNIFQDSKIKCNLTFEPILNNLNTYLESSLDILHINVESINDKPLKICLDDFGELQYYKCRDLCNTIKTECGLSKIKLLIVSTQNKNEMKPFFNNIGIKNVIYIDNKKTYPEPNEQVENFVKELYKNILNGKSIQESFNKNKGNFKEKNIVDIIPPSKKKKDYIISPEEITRFKSNTNDIKLNKNCSLNLDFVKYNYRRIIGRNIELKNCIDKIHGLNSVCVCGYPGAGKKSFVQHVGKFVFERNMYQEVHYLEIYYLRNADQILLNKKNEIKENIKLSHDNQLEFNEKKILLIINFNYVVYDENDIPTFEELLNKMKDKYFSYLYTFTINNKLSFSTIKKKLSKSSLIELNKLEKEKRKNLFYFISHDLKNINLTKTKEEQLVNSSNGYPNDIYLRTALVNSFPKEINNLDFSKSAIELNELIFIKFIEKYGGKIIKIFSAFTILKLGIRGDVLSMFFEKDEINLITSDLKYIIFEEKDKKGKNYLLDGSYINLIQNILFESYKNEFSKYLKLILEKYAIIFRYLVSHTNYPYNMALDFHAGINRGFWLTINIPKYYEEFKKAYDSNKIKDIYFDEVIYYNNVLLILINDEFIKIIEKNKEQFMEYISQISICLPTLLHFQHNKLFEKRIVELLKERLGYLNLNKSRLRLKMYQCWFNKDSNLVPYDSEINNIINDKSNVGTNKLKNELRAEFNLIKIYDYIIKKERENLGIRDIYYECANYSKDNNFNLAKLNILYGIALNNKNNKEFFDKAVKISEKDKNLIYMQILSLIMIAEYYLTKNDFDEFNKLITQCEEKINQNKENLQNTDIIDRKNKAIKDKNEKYKRHTKNKLFFFASSPFFDEKGNPLKTESNNSFYLKYNLVTQLPKNLKIEFNNIGKDFLTDLKKCLENPVRFLYIGSDQFNDKGNLFHTNDFKSCRFNSELIKAILENSKNRCDIVILGFLNSEAISKYFLSNKFPHIIYIKKIKELNLLFKDYSYLYFYFERCFHIFITEFLLNLSKKYCAIKEAFMKANIVFINKFSKILDFVKDKEKIRKNILSKQILVLGGDEKRDYEVFFEDFEDLNNQSFSSSSSSLNLVNLDSKSSFGSNYTDNSLLKDSSSLYYEDKKEISKDKEKKFMQFFKFPKGDLIDEIFEKLYNNRIYGMKEVFSNLINTVLSCNYKFINLYGDSDCGKTRICLELCKYFYMDNKFKEGIFYINLKKKKQIHKEELKFLFKENNGENKDVEIKDALLVFDDFDQIKKGLYSFISKLNCHTIIVTKEKETKFFEGTNNNKNKYKKNNIIINHKNYVDLNIKIDKNFALEFINYMKIINNIDENITINEYDNNDIYIKYIVEKIKDNTENLNKRKKYLSSSQINI